MPYPYGNSSTFEKETGAPLAVQGQPDYTGISYRTSTQAVPIPIVWGTRRIAPNIIWMTPFVPSTVPTQNAFDSPDNHGEGWTLTTGAVVNFAPHTFHEAAGAWRGELDIVNALGPAFHNTSYGTGDSSSSDSSWWVPMVMALCEGPITDVVGMWNGGGANRVPFAFPATYAFTLKPPSLFYEVFAGTNGQGPWGYWAAANTNWPGSYANDEDLSYRLTAYLASPVVNCGAGLTPPQQSFEVLRTPDNAFRKLDSYGLSYDYSPGDFLPDLLTSPQYGMGLLSTDFDHDNLGAFTAYVFAQGIFLSPLLDSQKTGVDILNRWAVECNTWIYWDGSHIVFVPLGDEPLTANGQTYTPDTTPAYNLGPNDFIGDGIQVTRVAPVDAFNRVRLEFPDRLNNYAVTPIEWKDTTLINQFGIRDASSVSADDICDVVVAATVLDLIGKRTAYIRNTYSFTLGYPYIRILPGTIVTLTDANLGLSQVPVRVQSVEEADDGGIAIVAEEYPGTLGIARPLASQPWLQNKSGIQGSGSSAGGIGGSGTIGNGGNPVSGSYTAATSDTLILINAGSTTTGAAAPAEADLVFRPASGTFATNPAKFTSGGTYTIEDPNDAGNYTAASTVEFRDSGTAYRFRFVSSANKYVIAG